MQVLCTDCANGFARRVQGRFTASAKALHDQCNGGCTAGAKVLHDFAQNVCMALLKGEESEKGWELPIQHVLVTVELGCNAKAGILEHSGNALLLGKGNEAFALAAVIEISTTRETGDDTIAHFVQSLGGYIVEQMKHTLGIAQRGIVAIAVAGREVGQGTEVQWVDHTNEVVRRFFTLR